MTLGLRLPTWVKRLLGRGQAEVELAGRREFVYLDEVSVYSLLASHKAGVADTFTETATASLTSDLGSSIGAAGTSVSAGVGSNQSQSSQVVRKATVQTHFKELYEIEQPMLAIGALGPTDPPTVMEVEDLEAMLRDSARGGWAVGCAALSRGELIEVNVELDTDPLFRLSTVINTVRRLIDENAALFARSGTTQLDEMRAVAQVLESLLEGLVPVRGRLVDYAFATIAGEDVLIHTAVLEKVAEGARPATQPVYVVGVAEHSFFWKDIRRTLFAKPRYTMLCRIAATGLSSRWSPTPTVDLLGALAPEFEERMSEFTSQAEATMRASARTTATPPALDARGESVLRTYIALLAERKEAALPSDIVDELLNDTPKDDSWLSSVDSWRPVFASVTDRVDEHLGVETSPEEAHEARWAAVRAALYVWPGNLEELSPGGIGADSSVTAATERFLDSEIVAIYW